MKFSLVTKYLPVDYLKNLLQIAPFASVTKFDVHLRLVGGMFFALRIGHIPSKRIDGFIGAVILAIGVVLAGMVAIRLDPGDSPDVMDAVIHEAQGRDAIHYL